MNFPTQCDPDDPTTATEPEHDTEPMPPAVELPAGESLSPRPRRKLRSQPRNPLRPETRLSVTGRPAEVEAKLRAIEEVREQLKSGVIGQREAALRLSRAFRGPATWADAWDSYRRGLRTRWAQKAASIWAHRLGPTFATLRIWEADDARLREWEAGEIKRGMAPKTQKCSWELLKTIGRRAVAAGLAEATPWTVYRPAKCPKGLKREACTSLVELQALVFAARDRDLRSRRHGSPGDLALRILIVALCGLRQGEAAGLSWDYTGIDDVPAALRIEYATIDQWQRHNPSWMRPMDPPKDGPRAIVLHPSAVEALKAHREDLQRRGAWRPDGPVFPRDNSGAWRSHAEVIDADIFRDCVKAAGLPRVDKWSPHSLRHTFATLELASGGDQRSVMDRTGHSSVAVLQQYLHASGRGLPASAIPLLGAATLEAVGAGADRPPPPSMLAELVDLTAEAGKSYEREAAKLRHEKATARRRRRGARGRLPLVLDLAELARAWVAAPLAKHTRPEPVTAQAERHYRRAYLSSLRRKESIDVARKCGGDSRRAFLRAWESAIAAAAKNAGPA